MPMPEKKVKSIRERNSMSYKDHAKEQGVEIKRTKNTYQHRQSRSRTQYFASRFNPPTT